MKVKELIEKLKDEPQGCELMVYAHDGEPVELNKIVVGDSDGDTATSIFDGGKPELSLLSTVWLMGVGAVLSFGKRKYDAHNWRKGIEMSRLMSASMRHILAFNEGEDLDPESGLHHLDHASCCLMFARELVETNPGEDDRYKRNVPKESDGEPQFPAEKKHDIDERLGFI